MIAIDGPAGAGKSTVARGVARALGFLHLDTGAMYRALTSSALRQGVDPSDAAALGRIARVLDIGFDDRGLAVHGRPAGPQLRSRRVSLAASAVSAHPSVRRAMIRRQRELIAGRRVVVEGRDIGTVVAPAAAVKIFLTASIEERARRRYREMARAGDTVSFATLKREISRRDAMDSTRAVSPLAPAPDAVIVDTTAKPQAAVVREVVAIARARLEPEGQRKRPRPAPTRARVGRRSPRAARRA